jgi:hypothetical protein
LAIVVNNPLSQFERVGTRILFEPMLVLIIQRSKQDGPTTFKFCEFGRFGEILAAPYELPYKRVKKDVHRFMLSRNWEMYGM